MGNFFISHLRDPKTMCISRLDLSMDVPNSHLERFSSFGEIVQKPTLQTDWTELYMKIKKKKNKRLLCLSNFE